MKNRRMVQGLGAVAWAAAISMCGAQEPATNDLVKGQTITQDFEGELDARWKISGSEISEERAHGGSKSLKVGKQAELILSSNQDLPVRVSMWIWDAGEKFTENANGPAWGVGLANKFQFAIRIIWRRYLDGNKVYAWFNTENNKWFTPKNTRIGRKEGWSQWVFDFTNPEAVKVTCNDKPVALDAEWTPKGAVSVFLMAGKDGGALFVDDITVEYPEPTP